MSLIFTVFLPNKSRYRLEISKSTPLYQGLEKVCTEKGYLPPHNFAFRYNKSYPDLGTPVGMLNLSNLTELELVPASEAPSKGGNDTLSIALQYGTQRYTEVFSCDTSLWDLIAEFALKHPGWMPVSLEPGHHPVLVHMRHEVPGEQALRGTSLRQLGLQPGSPPALIRLAYRPVPAEKLEAASKAVEARNASAATAAASIGAAKPVAAASESAPEPATTVRASHATVSSYAASEASSSDANLFSPFRTLPAPEPVKPQQQQREPRTLAEALNLPSFDAFSAAQQQQLHQEAAVVLPQQPFRFPEETAGQDLYRNELAEVKPAEFGPCDRRTCVYMAGVGASTSAASDNDASASDAKMEEPDDAFFNLTESDMRKLMADLKRKVDEETNAPLLTRQQREQRRDDLYSSYELSVIRLFFPDRHVVQAAFRPRETVFSLTKFVRNELLRCPESDFFLYTTPPKKEITDMAQFLLHADLVPMPIVYVGFRTQLPDGGQPILKDEIVSMTTSREHCDKVALSCMRSAVEPIYAKQQEQRKQLSAQTAGGSKGASASSSGSSNMPKWFKK